MSYAAHIVIPAKAGIHNPCGCGSCAGSENMDSRLRGNDGKA
jgi:hypothetical protein